jgi:hypothetical protein
MGSHYGGAVDALVLEKPISCLCFRPVLTGLVYRAFWCIGKSAAQVNQPLVPPLVTQIDFGKFLLGPTRIIFIFHCIRSFLVMILRLSGRILYVLLL